MNTSKISTRLRNLMNQYIGKKFDAYFYNQFFYTIKVISTKGDSFIVEINSKLYDISYKNLTRGIKNNEYREIN